MSRKKNFPLPIYSVILIVLVFVLYFSIYYISPFLVGDRYRFTPSLAVDGMIPFFPPAAIIYVIAYVQWVVCIYFVALQKKEIACKSLTGACCALLMAAVVFVVYPTQTVRPEILGDSFSEKLLSFLYAADAPINLLPSFHCIASWFSFRALAKCDNIPRWINTVNFLLSVSVFASTLLVKQHFLLDVVFAVAFMEIGFLISEKMIPAKIYNLLPDGSQKSQTIKNKVKKGL